MFDLKKNTRFLKIMKEKVPIFVIGIQTLIANTIYSQTFLTDININIDKLILINFFWIYFPILCIICGIWEFYNAIDIYKNKNLNIDFKHIIIYSILSTISSIITFIIFSFYINDGRPFIILFNYNYLYVSIIFYSWGIILSILNFIEQYYYDKLLIKQDEETII